MYTTEKTKAITQTSWFLKLFILSHNEAGSNLPSRLGIVFLLDSGAFNSVSNIPTYMMNTQTLYVVNRYQHDPSKLLKVVNQPKNPIKQNLYLTCFSSVEKKSIIIWFSFAVAAFKNNALEKVTFEFLQWIPSFHLMINPQLLLFSPIEKNFPFFSFTYQTSLKKQTLSHTHSNFQALHLPPKNTKTLLFKSESIRHLQLD